MTHARIPDFSQPVPVRSTSARTGRRRLSADGRYLNLPNEPVPGEIEPWQLAHGELSLDPRQEVAVAKAVAMLSTEVAELIGKRHDHVMRDARKNCAASRKTARTARCA